ncbi:hypothetical protein HGRIS_013109 [Hohenbuehelia grisea]|uniref:ClpP/crotonase n=1 Tax=Hohenbuehelia grisea TaxID=104357 RepID=A0ABR3IUE5_9AGAR
MSEVTVDISHGIATITMNRPKSLNAITPEDYDKLANVLREVDKRDDVVATVWQATGRWFCAGTDVKQRSASGESVRDAFLGPVARSNLDTTNAMYSHSKILVAALNGPAMGIAAAFLGNFDLIYCMPDAWISTPFSLLAIVAEARSSVTFANRMGVAKATEALLFGRKVPADELLRCGFVNKIFPAQPVPDFHSAVRAHLLDQLDGLDPVAVLTSKKLIRQGLDERSNPDAAILRESYAQAERFASGRPKQQFQRIANKEIRHKL